MEDGCKNIKIEPQKHHIQQELCRTRQSYRQGRKLTAVKVDFNDESQHIIISGVPKLQLLEEVRRIALPYGAIKELDKISEYPGEEFTETIHVRYERIQSARIAKRFLDGRNFYGGSLHVFYAPELETVAETRKKLIQRRRDVSTRIKRNQQDFLDLKTHQFEPKEQYHRQKKHPALPLTEDRLHQQFPEQSWSSIYDGIPREIDPRPVSEPNLPSTSTSSQSTSLITKKRNYKGQIVKNNQKMRVIRPQLIDTTEVLKTPPLVKDNKVLPVVKKVNNSIKIKILSNLNDSKKRIVIKDERTTQLICPSESLQTSIEKAKASIREIMMKK